MIRVRTIALAAVLAGCRANAPVPTGPAPEQAPAPAVPSRIAPATPAAESAAPPKAPEVLGSTCSLLDETGAAAAGRVLGAAAGDPVVGGQCAAGERLELRSDLAPCARYFVEVFAAAPVERVSVLLEVHPEMGPPLIAESLDVPREAPLVASLPQHGALWQQGVVAPARLLVTADRGVGAVAARLHQGSGPHRCPPAE